MNASVDLTISIVAYNDQEEIERVIESIYLNISPLITKHVFVIDNSDIKNTIEKLEEKYDTLTVIRAGTNLGFGKAHNLVIGQLKSNYHAIVNPDIELCSDTISSIFKFMDDDSIGMCIPRLLDQQGNIQNAYRREVTVLDIVLRTALPFLHKSRQKYHSMQDMDYSKPFHVPFAQGSFLVIRTELWKQLRGFDDRYFMYMEDADLSFRVNQLSRVMYCPDACAIHTWERGSHKNLRLMIIHMASVWKYFLKWGLKIA